jgi:quercetin dioxygenase-like cupin family protein
MRPLFLRAVPAPIPQDGDWNARIEEVERDLLGEQQVEMPLTHRFAPGVYLREIFMPAGTFVIGHEHRTEHFNVVLSGRASVLMNGEVTEIVAPHTFVSGPGVRKILYIHEDMRWQTVHPTDETDLENLEDQLIIKSTSYRLYQQEIAQLQSHIQTEQHP